MKRGLKVLALGAILVMSMGLLAGCGGQDYDSEITVYNWGDYIDQSVLTDFEEEYNIKVNYEMFDTNEDMYVKIANGAGKYDVAIPSDYMIAKMIAEDMLLEIDFANVPNDKYIDDTFKNLGFDPENKYSVPYMWGTVGIVYNTTLMDEVPMSWDILWDEKYSQNIFMLNSQRDSIAVALKKLGYSINTKNEAELLEAKEALIEQKPLVRAYVGDEVKDKMIAGEAAMAVVWSGDAAYLMSENPDLAYAIPEEGTNYWFDSMVIPTTSTNKEGAELFINYMASPEVALKNSEYIGYATPNNGAKDLLPAEVTGDRKFYPTMEDLKNSEVFVDLSDFLPFYDKIWADILAV